MSQIPGFPLGSMSSSQNQQPQQNIPPNMIFSQQHLLPHQAQRATQAQPTHPQGVSGIPDSEHRRIWQLDQQVRANPGDPAQANFTQMAQYFRNSGLHHQQGNLQGFQPQIQAPNVNPSQAHHLMNSNTNQAAFNAMVAHLSPAQLQSLDPAFRHAVQQRLGQQHAQQQNAGGMSAPHVDLGFSPPTSHSVNTNAFAADLARQYDLISRASQNQGQNGNANLNPGNPPLTRPGQVQGLPNSSVMGQQFQQTNSVQVQPNMASHQQSIVQHQNSATAAAAQHAHMNRQMYSANSSVDGSNIAGGSNAAGNIPNNISRVHLPGSIQSATSAGVTAMNAINTHRRLEVQLTALEKMLKESGWYPGIATTTDQQRKWIVEYEQMKNLYNQYRNMVAQMPTGVTMHANGTISQSTPNARMVHGWHPGQAGQEQHTPNVNLQQLTPRVTSGNAVPQQTHMSGSTTSSFPQQSTVQQQPQAMFASQQQSSLPLPRAPSAQSMNSVMQQVQQQQQRPPTASISGSMYDLQQGQPANSQSGRPPTAPPQPNATNAPQTNGPPIRTPMQNQGPASIPQNAQSIPSNMPPRQSPSGDNMNSKKAEFDLRLKYILEPHGIKINTDNLFIDTREVQLHELFQEVMRRGASAAVTQNDLWSIIGASLGFVQFPGTGSEPPRSSPGIADHLRYLYETYLLAFEQLHLNQLSQDRRKLAMQAQLAQNSVQPSQQQLTAQQQQAGQRHPNGVFPFIPNPAVTIHTRQQNTEVQAQQQQQKAAQNVPPQHFTQSAFHGSQPGQRGMGVNTYAQMAHMSADELRKMGVPENTIALIEQNRPLLQKQLMQQLQQQRGQQTQTQQGQMAQANFSMSQIPNLRPNIQSSVNGEGSQMHPGNVAQLSQQPQHHSQGQTTYQQTSTQAPTAIPQIYPRPTPVQLNLAGESIRQIVADQTSRLKRSYTPQVVRDVERSTYALAFKQLIDHVMEMEKKLPMFHAFFKDVGNLHRLIGIIIAAKEQNKLLSTGSNQFILSLQMVTRFLSELRNLTERFQQVLVNSQPVASAGSLSNPSLVNQPSVASSQAPNETGILPQPVQGAAQLQQPHQIDAARAQSLQHQQNLQVPVQTQPISKNKRPPGGVANTPSPAAPTTPFNNAPTPPANSSPRTPKSPPKKPSQAATHTSNPPTNTAQTTVPKPKPVPMNRRLSRAGQAPAAVSPAALAVEEPKTGTKRPREEDSSSGARPIPQVEPVAKKPKTEDWDGPINEELERRHQEINNLETNQDVQNFLARATDDILISGVADSSGEEKALQEFLSSATSFGIPDPFHMSAFVDSKFSDLSPSVENDTFLNSLFDFSKCATDDPVPSGSKLDPPDLLHSSTNPSGNPSPESAAETPKHENASINGKHRDNAVKIEIVDESSTHNSLERSLWTEINNGEPAYYEHTNFKYDCELTAQGSPWAISGGA